MATNDYTETDILVWLEELLADFLAKNISLHGIADVVSDDAGLFLELDSGQEARLDVAIYKPNPKEVQQQWADWVASLEE